MAAVLITEAVLVAGVAEVLIMGTALMVGAVIIMEDTLMVGAVITMEDTGMEVSGSGQDLVGLAGLHGGVSPITLTMHIPLSSSNRNLR
ncbi:hypothetical protein [Syntrophus gentianae]|uniref:hypothetical protein n=1 Tax=Syntrophus gentianae TaxID=43775 RepID=UPI001113398E|nr:hypothetical protein [Syntrophus gentianae]